MGDVFLEYIIKQKPSPKMILIKVLIVVAAIAVTFLLMSLNHITILATFLPAIFLAMCFVVYKTLTSLSYEYEYIVTNGELDIDKIIAKSSRKRVFNARPAEIEILAPLEEAYRDDYERGTFAKTIDAASSISAENRWFIIANSEKEGRVRVIFEPTDKMVENIHSYVPKKVMRK